MSKDEALRAILEVITNTDNEINEPTKRSMITEKTCPIKEIANFDSLMGVLVTLSCLAKFNLKAESITSLFVGKKTHEKEHALNIEESAELLVEISKK